MVRPTSFHCQSDSTTNVCHSLCADLRSGLNFFLRARGRPPRRTADSGAKQSERKICKVVPDISVHVQWLKRFES